MEVHAPYAGYTAGMEEFSDVARARTSYQAFVDALNSGREIMRRAGVPDPPPIPEFDAVFRRMPAEVRQKLYAALRENPGTAPVEAIRVWQPLIKSTFGLVKK